MLSKWVRRFNQKHPKTPQDTQKHPKKHTKTPQKRIESYTNIYINTEIMNKCEIYVFMCIHSLLIKNTEELIKGR